MALLFSSFFDNLNFASTETFRKLVPSLLSFLCNVRALIFIVSEMFDKCVFLMHFKSITFVTHSDNDPDSE